MAIRIKSRFLIAAAYVLIPFIMHAHEISAPATATRMVQAAEAFLGVLSPEQRNTAWFPFED